MKTLTKIATTALLCATLPVLATIRTGTNTADSGAGSLRDTIAASAAGDTIQFSATLLGTPHIVLTSTNLFIGRDLTITANRRVLIDGNGAFRVFWITAGNVTLSGLTITNGFASVGAGIYNQGNLTVNNCTFIDNTATSEGGGLANFSGSLTVNNCYFQYNGAGDAGGGIASGFEASDTLSLNNSTFNGNGGGSFGGGGVASAGITSINHCTFQNNASGGIAYLNGGTVTIQNTISAGNSGNEDVVGTFTSQGHNLIGATDGSSGWVASDRTGTSLTPLDALLGPVQNNGGGFTLTQAPLPGSAALDAGTSGGLSTDQIGQPRPYNNASIADVSGGDGSDIGAFEVQGPVITSQPQPPSQSANVGQNVTYTVAATDIAALSYHWRKDGVNIPSATSPSYTVNNAQLADTGNYSVMVTDAYGASTASDPALLVVGFGLTRITNGLGNIVAIPDQPSYTNNAPVALTATPAAGWQFVGWSGDLSGTNSSTNLVMTANKSVTANFVQLFTLTLASTGSGTVTNSPDQVLYASNTIVTVTATPSPGWGFYNWTGDLFAVTNPLVVVMTTNRYITGNFFQPGLVIEPSEGGIVIKNPDLPYSYPYNSTVTLTAIPLLGYTFTGWTTQAPGQNNPLVLLMTNNWTVTANFASNIPHLIVDNTNATFTGAWSTTAAGCCGAFGLDSRYTTTTSSSGATATFRPNLPATGNYDVYVWYAQVGSGHGNQAQCSDAECFVSANGTNETISVDQTSLSGDWLLIESARKFAQGTNGFVRLSNQSTNTGTPVSADAVRWVWSTNQVTQPYITSVTRSVADATLTWLSGSNYVYRMEYKTNLTDGVWFNVSGDVTATTNAASKTDSTLGNASSRFYRVELLQ